MPVAASQSSFESTLRSAKSSLVFRETMHLALDSFRASKVRFLLTMLGMIIGSASIVLVVTVGMTGRQYALETLSSIGPNMVEMQYNGGATVGADGASTPDYMTKEDEAAALAQVPGIAQSSPMLEVHAPISIGDGKSRDIMLLGVSPRYKDVRNLGLLSGRFFDDQDSLSHEKVGMIAKPLAKTLFGSSDAAVGKVLNLSGIPITIIGVFWPRVDTFGQSEISDDTVLLPYPVARYMTGTDTVKEIFFTMKDPADVPRGAERILALIQSRHRKGSKYTAFTMVAILDTMKKVADSLTYVLTAAAFITLVVSGVGIMNSMLANVTARYREIGIRKALGATRREIRLQFLTEAVFLSLSGGVVGTLLGLALPITVNLLTPVHIPMSGLSAVVALLTSVLVGVIFGTVPANRAAALDPVEMLKYE